MTRLQKQLCWLVVFSIAMGLLETAVVVYLRELYYPEGFQFPLAPMNVSVFTTELLREAATLIMLWGVAYLAGSSAYQRFAFFLIAFAVWDIFYYVFLKVLLDWPESLLTWDILFLIPTPWVGPVLAPCLASVTMVLLAIVILRHHHVQGFHLNPVEWSLLGIGSLVMLVSWIWDYLVLFGAGIPSPEQSIAFYATYKPQTYHWWMFGIGELFLLAAILMRHRRTNP